MTEKMDNKDAHNTFMYAYFDRCRICNQPAIDGTTRGGWFDYIASNHKFRIHYDCADWLIKLANAIRSAPVMDMEGPQDE